ncbi:MAG: hypothetical protein AAF371_05700 [Pseudomonadota bacterium]
MPTKDVRRARAAGVTASRAARIGAAGKKGRINGARMVLAVSAVALVAAIGFYGFSEFEPGADGSASTSGQSDPESTAGVETATVDARLADDAASDEAEDSTATDSADAAGTDPSDGTATEAAETVAAAPTGLRGSTPGLNALRSLGDPLPPAPALPGVPSPAGAITPPVTTAALPATDEAAETPAAQGDAVTSAVEEAEAAFECPLSGSTDGLRFLVPFQQGGETPPGEALGRAAAFGKAASLCPDATITVIGYASKGRNPLEEAMAGLNRARAFVELLTDSDVDTSRFQVFAEPQDDGEKRMPDGVEIRVK